ncbi:MAG: hypothetical protein ACRCXX_12485 [Cetobacterium sp.]|uniref:hypothetical protein n=1 Tax=Bacteria TaxID=2 RepID=UPI003EE4E737
MISKILPVLNKIIGIFGKNLENKKVIEKEKLNYFHKTLSVLLIVVVVSAMLMSLKGDNLGSYWYDLIDTILKYMTV